MPHFPLSFTASSNLPSAMAVVTSLVWWERSWRDKKEYYENTFCHCTIILDVEVLFYYSFSTNWGFICFRYGSNDSPLAHTPLEAAWQPCFQTSWPHMQESLVWPPAEPSQIPHPSCWPDSQSRGRHLEKQVHLYLITLLTRSKIQFSSFHTRILSKAEGVPPLWTWPKMVVRVSKPSLFDTSWREGLWIHEPHVKSQNAVGAAKLEPLCHHWPLWLPHMWLVFPCDWLRPLQ